MKILIAYYSRTNTTKKIAQALAGKLGADVEVLIDTKNRAGITAYVIAGKDAIQKKLAQIEPVKLTVQDYELVVVGSPVWAGTFAPALRTYLSEQKDKFKNLAFFVTQGAKPPKQVGIFDELENLCGKKSIGNLHLSTKQVMNDNYQHEIDKFVAKINGFSDNFVGK